MMVENSSDFICLATLEDQPLYMNAAGLRLVGLPGPQVPRLRVSELVSAEDTGRWKAEIQDTVRREGRWEGELRLRHAGTQALIPVSCNTFVIHEPGSDRALAVASVARDSSAQKQHEAEALKRAEFERRLVGIVSHDLRSPLQAITVSSHLMLKAEQLTPRGASLVKRIVNSTGRMDELVDKLLDFTQAELGQGIPIRKQPADPHEISGAWWRRWRRRFQAGASTWRWKATRAASGIQTGSPRHSTTCWATRSNTARRTPRCTWSRTPSERVLRAAQRQQGRPHPARAVADPVQALPAAGPGLGREEPEHRAGVVHRGSHRPRARGHHRRGLLHRGGTRFM